MSDGEVELSEVKADTMSLGRRSSVRSQISVRSVSLYPSKQGLPGQLNSQWFSLHQIARDGNVSELEAILQNDEGKVVEQQLNELDDNINSPLHYAARYSHERMVRMLLSMKVEVDKIGSDGMSPLHYAARYGKNINPKNSVSVSGACTPTSNGLTAKTDLSDLNNLLDTDNSSYVVSVVVLLLEAGADINLADMYGLTPLHHAAMRGNIKVIHKLLQYQRINVSSTDVQGSTPLHMAATYNRPGVIERLLLAGASIDVKDKEGQTPLHRAAQEGNLECVDLLLKKIPKEKLDDSIKEKDQDGSTVLMLAVGSGDSKLVKLILSQNHRENQSKVNIPNNQREYPLHSAARVGDLQTVKLLLKYGGQIDGRNVFLQTPLYLAAMHDNEQVVEYLIEEEANLNLWDFERYSPLMIAASEGHLECVEMLVNAGAQLDSLNKDDQNVIHLAAKNNRAEVLQFLLDHSGDDSLLNSNDLYDNTPLHLACEAGQLESVKILLGKNADIDNKNEDEQTPFHLAVINGRCSIIRIIIEKDRSAIFDKDENDDTSLHLAAINKQTAALQILVENGAQVQDYNSKDWTALDCAASVGALDCVKILLDFDAPVDPMDKAQTTPLHLAAQFGHHKTVELLMYRGADLSLEDIHGQNALEIALSMSRRAVVKSILANKGWKKAMRVTNIVRDRHGYNIPDTPMRMLIRTFPDLAEEVFDNCISHEKISNRTQNDNQTIHLDYEFIDDTFNMEEVEVKEEGNRFNYCPINEKNQAVLYEKPYSPNGQVRMDNHPLQIMTKQKQKGLLRHPLCIALVRKKWNNYGRYVFFTQLGFYLAFLFFITGYVEWSPNMIYKDRFNCSSKVDFTLIEENPDPVHIVCQYGVVITAGLGILAEIFQIIENKQRYLRWTNLFDWAVYVPAIIFVLMPVSGIITCDIWEMGAIMILFSWLNLLIDLRYYSFFGIYVIMFEDIFKTLMKFMAVFLVFIMAFAFGFSMLFMYQVPFHNSWWSILKTSVMMIGEFEYEEIFFPQEEGGRNLQFLGTSVFFFVLFLVIMSIIIVNLLVGLAVDDIKAVQEQAELKKLSLQVDLVLMCERYLPSFLLSRFSSHHQSLTISRNHKRILPSNVINRKEILDGIIGREADKDEAEEKRQSDVNNEMKETVAKIKREVDNMAMETAEIKKLLTRMAEKQQIGTQM